MLFKVAYLSNETRELLLNKNTKSLTILSAGRTKLIKRLSHTTEYKSRSDYQLLYVRSGCLHYIDKNSTEQIAPNNSFILYHPYEYQKYWTCLNENPDIYWCHFTGSFSEILLKNYGLYNKRTIITSPQKKFYRIFDNMRSNIDDSPKFLLELNSLLLQELIVSIANETHKNNLQSNFPEELKVVLNFIHEHYNEDIKITDLSNLGYTNTVTLTRQFNKYLMCSPKLYLNRYRIERAKILLSNSSYRINEIASIVGFTDPLYFSTAFRNETGLSPKEYRNKNQIF